MTPAKKKRPVLAWLGLAVIALSIYAVIYYFMTFYSFTTPDGWEGLILVFGVAIGISAGIALIALGMAKRIPDYRNVYAIDSGVVYHIRAYIENMKNLQNRSLSVIKWKKERYKQDLKYAEDAMRPEKLIPNLQRAIENPIDNGKFSADPNNPPEYFIAPDHPTGIVTFQEAMRDPSRFSGLRVRPMERVILEKSRRDGDTYRYSIGKYRLEYGVQECWQEALLQKRNPGYERLTVALAWKLLKVQRIKKDTHSL